MAELALDQQEIARVFDLMADTAQTMSASYVPMAQDVLWILFVGMVAWTWFSKALLAEGVAEAVSETVSLVFVAFPIWALLSGWQEHIAPFFLSASSLLVEPLGVPGGGWGGGFAKMLGSMAELFKAIGNDFFSFSVEAIVSSVVNLVLLIAAQLIMVIASIIYALMLYLGDVLIAVGLIIGPILLPWSLLPWTAGMGGTWAKFMISGVLYKIVGAVLTMLSAGMVEVVASRAASSSGEGVSVGAMVMILFWAVVIAFMMMQIPALASALAGGGPSVRAGGAPKMPTKSEKKD